MKVRLAVKLGKLKLQNPVMAASGTFGWGEEYRAFFDVNRLGAIITKTVTLQPRTGNPPPRVAETPSGMLNAIGLENKGVDTFLKEAAPFLKRLKGPRVIVSVASDSERELKELVRRIDARRIADGIELNLSCPNIMEFGILAQSPAAVRRMVRAAKKASGAFLIAKLSPNVTDIAEVARAAQAAGADAVSLINTFPAMAVDIGTRMPVLGNVTGGLSGPAIRPIALKMVRDAYHAVDIPVIGGGGIMTAGDALEFIICGASAVQVGTAHFVDPRTPLAVITGIARYLTTHRLKAPGDLVGTLRLPSHRRGRP